MAISERSCRRANQLAGLIDMLPKYLIRMPGASGTQRWLCPTRWVARRLVVEGLREE
jgi:hypothetical protein